MVPVQRVSKAQAKQWLSSVPGDKVFYCVNGEVYNNLADLKSALDRLQNDHFVYHVNSEKNDFGNWIRDVIGDQKLAQDIRGCKTRDETLSILDGRVAFLTKRLK